MVKLMIQVATTELKA